MPNALNASTAAPLTRTVWVCHACGTEYDPADEPAPIDGCEAHGVKLVQVELLRASALTGREPVTPWNLTTEQIEKVSWYLECIEPASRTPRESMLLVACEVAGRRRFDAREVVADAYNALVASGGAS